MLGRTPTALRGLSHGSASGDERGEDVDLASGRRPRERSPQVPVSQAGLTWLRVMSPRTTAVTARIAPIWSGCEVDRPNATTRAITAWTRARTIAGSRPQIVPGWLSITCHAPYAAAARSAAALTAAAAVFSAASSCAWLNGVGSGAGRMLVTSAAFANIERP